MRTSVHIAKDLKPDMDSIGMISPLDKAGSAKNDDENMSKVASKTRDLMIDVARQLFAKLGLQNTTMNDIADKAMKGRRTLYTYFRNKDEVVTAVVEHELNTLYTALVHARNLCLKPENKLMHFAYIHLETMKEIVFRNGSLKADFFRDIWRVEKSRKEFDSKEVQLICEILQEGVDDSEFEISDLNITAKILLNIFKGLEVPYISGYVRHVGSQEFERIRKNLQHLIFGGIRSRERRQSIGNNTPMRSIQYLK